MVTLEHVVRYDSMSGLDRQGGLHLACAADQSPLPLFFQGRLLAPRRAALLLLALARVVGSRFHTPAAMLARILRESDPVVTCAPEAIRWEGFSACGGVYARVDLLPEALEGALLGYGTTNVDLGPKAREALARIDRSGPCELAVGAQHVELAGVTERKVALPVRWLKGLGQVQALMAEMPGRFVLNPQQARRLLHSLPKGPSREAGWLEYRAREPRLTQIESTGAVRLAGWQRLEVLSDLLGQATSLRIYSHEGGASAWEVLMPEARFSLVLSPEVWRGFSGEGQLLLPPAPEAPQPEIELDWHRRLQSLDVRQLNRLALRGQLGYQLDWGYFYRPLPYPYARLLDLEPRLQQARKLSVKWDGGQAWVDSSGTPYRVAWEGSRALCNCPWYAKHGLERGPCKHILAAQIDLDKEQP
ncbi:MAG: SWIM zinc finger family protein [Vulcanimicrobiota bacterium]